MKIKDFFAAIGTVVSVIVAGILSFLFLDKLKKNNLPENLKPEEEIKTESEKAKEEKENEIKNTDSHDLAESSDHSSDIQSGIEQIQTDSTSRIRDRIKQKL